MTRQGDLNLEWDWNGNLGLKDYETHPTTFDYNWDNKLRQASYDGNTITLKYDPMGNRVYKHSTVIDTTRKYFIDIASGLPTILLDNAGHRYIWANGEILMKGEGYDKFFYLHDRLGSVRQVLKYARVMNSLTYGPFGDLLTAETAENTENPFKYTGQFYDSEIGQYYLRARYYNPEIGRFLQTGPIGYAGGLNLYSYCGNNPLNWIDPWGLCKDHPPGTRENPIPIDPEAFRREVRSRRNELNNLPPYVRGNPFMMDSSYGQEFAKDKYYRLGRRVFKGSEVNYFVIGMYMRRMGYNEMQAQRRVRIWKRVNQLGNLYFWLTDAPPEAFYHPATEKEWDFFWWGYYWYDGQMYEPIVHL